MGTARNAELKVILDLTELLNRNADKVQSGETKVCLTTSSLGILAACFRRYSESLDSSDVEAAGSSSWISRLKQRKSSVDHGKWRENVRTLFDFIIKIKSLKIILGSNTLKAPVQIARFRALQVLEVKKIPIHMVEGLSKLRGQLKELTIIRSAQTLQDVLEICGGDRSSGFIWTNLKTLYVSHNGFKQLDNSLRFIPFVEVLDLSHNTIQFTEDFLQHLTDISQVNFGYNMLTTVPQFSYSNKGKLKTLVLRNNNLDNLEGIQELPFLEELDVMENCLIEHSVLHVLCNLDRLTLVCLIGNPLVYTSNHRLKVVKYLSPHTRLGTFLLDRQTLSAELIYEAKKNKFKRAEDLTDSAVTSTSIPNSSDDPLVVTRSPNRHQAPMDLLNPNSTHSEKKKRGHRRIKSRERIAKIADMGESYSESYDNSPLESSKEEEYIAAQIEMDKKKIEIMRKHYKDDWLKALSADQGKSKDLDDTDSASRPSDDNDSKHSDIGKMEAKDGKEDLRLRMAPEKVPDVGLKEMAPEKVPDVESKEDSVLDVKANAATDRETMEDDKTKLAEPNSEETVAPLTPKVTPPTVIKIEQTTDIYAFSRMESTELRKDSHMESFEDSLQQYGEESDPFIVMLPEDDMNHLIVTVNNRYIIEKNINGERREALDLKFLQGFHQSEEQLSGRDIIGGILFTVVTLKFDYARKDMRERRYAMEDVLDANALHSLLSKHLRKQEENLIECLKCQYRFPKTESMVSALPSCPKCKSKMLIKVDVSAVDPHQNSKLTTADSNKSTADPNLNFSVSPRVSPRLQRRSAYKRSTQRKVDTEKLQIKQDTQAVSQGQTNEIEGSIVKEYSVSTGLKPNGSWSDVQKAAIISTRSSVSSVESDITILTSHSSITGDSIAESSHEIAHGRSSKDLSGTADTVENNLSGHLDRGKESRSDEITIQNPSLKGQRENFGWIKDKNEELTPVGSPLSNSVCSSMVSSVYENTLSGTGKQQDSGSGDNTQNSSFTSSSTDSVSIRHSTSSHGRPKSNHRNAVVYTEGAFESASQVSDFVNQSESSYSTVPSLNVSEVDKEQSVQSIYDTVSDTDSMEKSADVSNTSPNLSQSTTDMSSSSSPLRRLRNSRRSKRNKDVSVREENVQDAESPSLYDFPSDISPIKRTEARRAGLENKRSAIVMDDEYFAELGSEEMAQISVGMSDDVDGKCSQDMETKHTVVKQTELPWEQQPAADLPLSGVNLDEFRNVDHRVQLYLELKVFKADEVCQCAIQCDIVQYMIPEPTKSLLVISSHRLLIFRIDAEKESDVSSDWLKCYEDQPIAELRYIDIGLGYQSLRMEFKTTCSSYTLLIADESRCKNFLALITEIVHNIDHSRLEGISKSNPVTLKNVDTDILLRADTDEEMLEEEEKDSLVRYLIVRYTDEDQDTESGVLMGLAVSMTDLVLIDVNHQWPLPRLQAPLSDSLKKKQFTVVRREKINNIESLMFNEFNPRELRLSFFETSDANPKPVWMISMETTGGVKAFVDAIRNPWEEEFGVSLDVTSTSFTDESNSSKQ